MTKENPQFLILYSTIDGHTKNICQYIENKLKMHKSITISSIEESDKYNISEFDQLLLGASVRYGYHRKNVYKFIQDNKDQLNTIKPAFFSVNLTARKSDKDSAETNPYIIKFLKNVDWQPTIKAVFAGKLDYPNLDCANKLAILFIMLITNGPKDISQKYELTKWNKVDELINLLKDL